MSCDIKKFQELVRNFRMLPEDGREPSFMEICSYPYNRFEEICSRILKFFFNPNAEHGMGYLWIVSLIDAVKARLESEDCSNNPQKKEVAEMFNTAGHFIGKVDIRLEENADGKRIDMIIECDSCVICIENKITASVYNPLDIYSSYLDRKYPAKKKVKILLSVKPVTNSAEYKKVNGCGFISVLYSSLFDYVKKYSGNYLGKMKYNYLLYMYDFMKTIENMDNVISKQEREFFYNNSGMIDSIIDRRNRYNEVVMSEQREQIAILIEMLGSGWGTWEGRVISKDIGEGNRRIGVDSWYEATPDSSCGRYCIFITTWCMEAWWPYKEKLKEKYPDYSINEYAGDKKNRAYMRMPEITGNNHEVIVNKLKGIYDELKKVVDEVNRNS